MLNIALEDEHEFDVADLMTLIDAARYLKISLSHIKTLLRENCFDFVLIGKRKFVLKNQLDEYVRMRMVCCRKNFLKR